MNTNKVIHITNPETIKKIKKLIKNKEEMHEKIRSGEFSKRKPKA